MESKIMPDKIVSTKKFFVIYQKKNIAKKRKKVLTVI